MNDFFFLKNLFCSHHIHIYSEIKLRTRENMEKSAAKIIRYPIIREVNFRVTHELHRNYRIEFLDLK